jgi:hypothetical protein
MTMMMIVFKIQ